MKNKYFFFFILISFVILGCNPKISKKSYDVIMYSNVKYEKTNVKDILVVGSRLKIKKKFFEIGVIKIYERIDLDLIKNIAAEKGANIIVDDSNKNFTLIRYKNQDQKESNDEKSIKT